MSDRKKNQKPQPVSNVLQNLFGRGDGPLAEGFMRWRVWHNWKQLVGERVGSYSIPVAFKDGVLSIWVKSAAHMQDLSFGSDLIKDKVNKFVGFPWVKKIRFTLDRKDVPSLEESEPGLREFLSKEFPSGDGEPQPGR